MIIAFLQPGGAHWLVSVKTLTDIYEPKRAMLAGFLVRAILEVTFQVSLRPASVSLVFIRSFLRGFGFPLFASALPVWIRAVATRERNGTVMGWFHVMFTGGLPTLDSMFAPGTIPGSTAAL